MVFSIVVSRKYTFVAVPSWSINHWVRLLLIIYDVSLTIHVQQNYHLNPDWGHFPELNFSTFTAILKKQPFNTVPFTDFTVGVIPKEVSAGLVPAKLSFGVTTTNIYRLVVS